MRFVWFWTFWHWSRESFRAGALLREPLLGIASHWDEWFCHEATKEELQSIQEIGSDEHLQQEFIEWLIRHWLAETPWRTNRSVPRFVLGQLALFAPFDQWTAFKKYRTGYGLPGISAIVLAEEDRGEPNDVRLLEAIVLPTEGEPRPVETEGFKVGDSELEAPRSAAISLLQGKGMFVFLALWILTGRRPSARWLKVVVVLGWLGVAGLIGFLLLGPNPDDQLPFLSAALISLWSTLLATAAVVAGVEVFRTWRQGTILGSELARSQIRLRMDHGLTLKGCSAGLPFCLNMLLALFRTDSTNTRLSWLWRNLFRKLQKGAGTWAATGVITSDGGLKPVLVRAKLQACIQRPDIGHLLTPRQADADLRTLPETVNQQVSAVPSKNSDARPVTTPRLGFAAENPGLRIHRCSHAAQALMALGELTSWRQVAVNLFATAASIAMIIALPDLRSILLPPPAPAAVTPSSPSPYYLWVSLDTTHPRYFEVVMESRFWTNRRVEVRPETGTPASVRAEIRLLRLTRPTTSNVEDGTVWIERRRRFLTREFSPGERVGRYSFSYLAHIGRE